MGFREWWKNAFAVEPPGAALPDDTQRPVVDRVCQEVVQRGLTVPALLLLETCRPLNFVSAQAIHFFLPILSAVTDTAGGRQFAEFLERRGSVAYLCNTIEQFSARQSREEDLRKSLRQQ